MIPEARGILPLLPAGLQEFCARATQQYGTMQRSGDPMQRSAAAAAAAATATVVAAAAAVAAAQGVCLAAQ